MQSSPKLSDKGENRILILLKLACFNSIPTAQRDSWGFRATIKIRKGILLCSLTGRPAVVGVGFHKTPRPGYEE